MKLITLFSQQLAHTDAMKLFPFVVFIVLVFTLTVPEDSEGKKPPPWLKEAMKILGKGIKKSHYARCKIIDAPANLNCPKNAYGVGSSEGMARKAAKYVHANFPKIWKKTCSKYLDEDSCEVYSISNNF